MNIHEYQAKALLKEFGVPVLAGGVELDNTKSLGVFDMVGEYDSALRNPAGLEQVA